LFRDNPETPEGKYLVKRRDGSVVEWPSFVLGGRDVNAEYALRFYALLNLLPADGRREMVSYIRSALAHGLNDPAGQNKEYVHSVLNFADDWEEYRHKHGDGDPLMGKHRIDDPATVEQMKKGLSA
jgi:hypothetical protein